MANENGATRGPEQALEDLDAQADPKGGHKPGGDKEKYMVVKLEEVIVSSIDTRPPSQG